MFKRDTPEKAYVIGIMTPKIRRGEAEESFDELKSLARTAGAKVMQEHLIDIKHFNPPTFIGTGKVLELKELIQIDKPDIIIIDYDLTPAQNRNLETTWQTRVVDRTCLILDIFAQRAQSKEGKLQVELAQYQYLLPRLVGAWTHLSKQKGGIGMKGPGETQLEVDRRRVRERISLLKKNLQKISNAREIHREKRQSVPIPTISLVGYTNAGKSTLFNSLLKSDEVVAEDKLFATLDPKTKKLRLPSGQQVLISDTVGFIRNLPHQLIESFKSTFEEVADADLLIHVIDVSHPDRLQQVQTVESVLKDLGLNDKPIIKVMTKMDRIEEAPVIEGPAGDVISVSGLKGFGMETLLHSIEAKLSDSSYRKMQLLIPHQNGKVLNDIYTHGCVLSTTSTEVGSMIEVNLPPKWQAVFKEFEFAY